MGQSCCCGREKPELDFASCSKFATANLEHVSKSSSGFSRFAVALTAGAIVTRSRGIRRLLFAFVILVPKPYKPYQASRHEFVECYSEGNV